MGGHNAKPRCGGVAGDGAPVRRLDTIPARGAGALDTGSSGRVVLPLRACREQRKAQGSVARCPGRAGERRTRISCCLVGRCRRSPRRHRQRCRAERAGFGGVLGIAVHVLAGVALHRALVVEADGQVSAVYRTSDPGDDAGHEGVRGLVVVDVDSVADLGPAPGEAHHVDSREACEAGVSNRARRQDVQAHHSASAVGCRVASPGNHRRQRPHCRSGGGPAGSGGASSGVDIVAPRLGGDRGVGPVTGRQRSDRPAQTRRPVSWSFDPTAARSENVVGRRGAVSVERSGPQSVNLGCARAPWRVSMCAAQREQGSAGSGGSVCMSWRLCFGFCLSAALMHRCAGSIEVLARRRGVSGPLESASAAEG